MRSTTENIIGTIVIVIALLLISHFGNSEPRRPFDAPTCHVTGADTVGC